MKRISLVVVAVLAVIFVRSALAGPPPVRIAFSQDTATTQPSVWVANGSGGARHKLGSGDQPLISPNGVFVGAEQYTGGAQLKVYRVAGGVHKLFNTQNVTVAAVAWSPNSRYLLVAATGATSSAHSYLDEIDTSTWKIKRVANGYIGGASFSPSGKQIVFSRATAEYSMKSNLFIVGTHGGVPAQITFGNNALDPVWGRKGIVFSREGCQPAPMYKITCRGINRYYNHKDNYGPTGQLWLKSGSHLTQLTHVSVGPLVYGLTPIGVSATGNRILAQFGGEDTDYAVAVQISPRVVHTVDLGTQYAVPGAISRDGNTLLIAYGSFEQPANSGTVDTVPFFGSRGTVLVRGASPSWNK